MMRCHEDASRVGAVALADIEKIMAKKCSILPSAAIARENTDIFHINVFNGMPFALV